MMNTRLLIAGLLPVIIVVLSAWLLPDDDNWKTKIDAGLLERASASGAVECLVVLQEQADVSGAKALRTKSEKGAYVFERLRAVAAQTQGPLLRILRDGPAWNSPPTKKAKT